MNENDRIDAIAKVIHGVDRENGYTYMDWDSLTECGKDAYRYIIKALIEAGWIIEGEPVRRGVIGEIRRSPEGKVARCDGTNEWKTIDLSEHYSDRFVSAWETIFMPKETDEFND